MYFAWLSGQQLVLGEDNRVVKTPLDGSNKTTLLSDVEIADVSACPDGRTILLSLSSRDIVGNTNTWKIGADGSNLKQLSKGRQEFKAECSPDSKWACFSDNTGNRVQRVSIDGGTPETVPGADVPDSIITSHALSLSPDGKTLAYTIDLLATFTSKIVMVPLDAGPKPQVRFS